MSQRPGRIVKEFAIDLDHSAESRRGRAVGGLYGDPQCGLACGAPAGHARPRVADHERHSRKLALQVSRIIPFALFLAAWQGLAKSGLVDPTFLPSVGAVGARAGRPGGQQIVLRRSCHDLRAKPRRPGARRDHRHPDRRRHGGIARDQWIFWPAGEGDLFAAENRADSVADPVARHRQCDQHRRSDVFDLAAVRRLHLSRHHRRAADPDLERARHGRAQAPAVVEGVAAGVAARHPHRTCGSRSASRS